jgi:hypothetical protein
MNIHEIPFNMNLYIDDLSLRDIPEDVNEMKEGIATRL